MRQFTSLALSTLAVNWTLTLVAFIAVTAMHYSIVRLSKPVRPDKILISAAFVVGVVLVSLSTWTILDEGQAEHQENVSRSQLELAAKSLLVAEALWTLATGLLRISAGLSLHTIFYVKKLARYTLLTIIALSAGLAAASAIQIFLICRPFAVQWDSQVLGTCGDQVASFMALESVGLVLDLGFILVPSVMILALNFGLKKKVFVLLVFNIGAVYTGDLPGITGSLTGRPLRSVLVVTGLRMAALRDAVSPDFTYSQSYLSLLSASGSMSGIICCTLPEFGGKKQESRVEAPPGREGGASDRDLENGTDSWTDTNSDDETPAYEAITSSEETHLPLYDESNVDGVALFDFHRNHENELSLDQGQLLRIHRKHGQRLLLAQNLTTNEIGLVPERFVQLRGDTTWSRDKKTERSKSLQSRSMGHIKPEPG